MADTLNFALAQPGHLDVPIKARPTTSIQRVWTALVQNRQWNPATARKYRLFKQYPQEHVSLASSVGEAGIREGDRLIVQEPPAVRPAEVRSQKSCRRARALVDLRVRVHVCTAAPRAHSP
jgi:hypothetical protein